MPAIDTIAIDAALLKCFTEMGAPRTRYVIVTLESDVYAIGTNMDDPVKLLADALRIVMQREPDIELVADPMGEAKGHA